MDWLPWRASGTTSIAGFMRGLPANLMDYDNDTELLAQTKEVSTLVRVGSAQCLIGSA